MKNILFVLSVCAALASQAAKPTISNLSVTNDVQKRTVIATYDLDVAAVVTAEVQTKESGEWKPLVGANSIAGANHKVSAGEGKTVMWALGRDFPGMTYDAGKLRLVLKAWDLETPPTWMVVDPTSFSQTYYSSKEMIPFGISNSLYKTEYIVLRKIPAKDVVFRMGSDTKETTIGSYVRPADETPHLVTFTNDWYMAIYECTQAQWMKTLHTTVTTSYWAKASTYNTVECPIENVDYNTIVGTFIAKLVGNTGIAFNLPTEAQWEYSCRAGASTALYDGNNIGDRVRDLNLNRLAWNKNNSALGGVVQPHPVGLREGNAFDLFDMLGNVRELVLDYYDANYGLTVEQLAASATTPIVDPAVTTKNTGDSHVKRGGLYNYNTEQSRCGGTRAARVSDKGLEEDGFRICAPAVVK